LIKFTVDTRDAVETYPLEPRPVILLWREREEIAFKLNKPLPFPVYKLAVTVFNAVAPCTVKFPLINTGAALSNVTSPAIQRKLPYGLIASHAINR
jgi:hypothetical protein